MSKTTKTYEYSASGTSAWRSAYQQKLVSAEEAVSHIHPGDKVAVMQAQGTPNKLLEALVETKESLDGITILGQILYEGGDILRKGYEKGLKHHSSFLANSTRKDYKDGKIDIVPTFFFETPRYYESVDVPDVALISVSMPDEHGRCSFSLDADTAVMLAKKAKTVIAQINKYLPRTCGSSITLDEITWAVEWHEPITEHLSKPVGEVELAISNYIAPMIPDGATLQLGIGGIPDTVLSALTDRKDLGIHTELLTDATVDLYRSGAITNMRKNIDQGKIVTTFLMGSEKLFDFVDQNEDVLVLPVEYTNDPRVIAQNDNVISINACLEVDLLGQVNSDTLFGSTFTGVGGQVDFVRGASMSKGGKSFLAMPSTAANGTISRIKCHLGEGSPVTTSRYDVHYVCTEYGVVDLRGKTLRERATSLISIAHPAFREELEYEARKSGLLI